MGVRSRVKAMREIQPGDVCAACGATVRATPGSGELEPTDFVCDCDSLGPQVPSEDPEGD